MTKVILLTCLCALFFGCSNIEEKAGKQLEAARIAYEQGDYNEAKLLIDSIKIVYPKAFETRRAGIALLQEVELKEQQQTLHYLDSLLQDKNEKIKAMSAHYTFEKDTVYQTIGNYLHPSQVIEKNLHRSFLRFQVDERGIMDMTSIYCGGRNIHHTGIKVSANGNFAETPVSADVYETTDLGEKIEKADFKHGKDGGVIDFIYLNKDNTIKVEYVGERPYQTNMTRNDRQAAAAVYDLAQILSARTQIQAEMQEACLKIEFVKKKIAERISKKASTAEK